MDNKHRPEAVPTVQVDNDLIRVTEWRFPPGAQTGWHRHEFDYVIVPITNGHLELISPAGSSITALSAGASYFRRAGVEHNVVNAGDVEFAFVEVELKQR